MMNNNPDTVTRAARVARRLRIAAVLLRLPANVDVLGVINVLPEQRRAELRAQVAWVEEFEAEEARLWRAPARVVAMEKA